jgi:hypothetical protein
LIGPGVVDTVTGGVTVGLEELEGELGVETGLVVEDPSGLAFVSLLNIDSIAPVLQSTAAVASANRTAKTLRNP